MSGVRGIVNVLDSTGTIYKNRFRALQRASGTVPNGIAAITHRGRSRPPESNLSQLCHHLTSNPQNITPQHQAQIEIGSRHRERSVVALVEVFQHVSG